MRYYDVNHKVYKVVNQYYCAMSNTTTIYVNDDQRARIKNLPRDVSFSGLIRDHFDLILEDYTEKKEDVIRKVR